MGCLSQYATAEEFGDFWCQCSDLDATETAAINGKLQIAANRITGALAMVGACDCTFSSYGLSFLKTINIALAAALHKCSCAQAKLNPEEQAQLLQWAEDQLAKIENLEFDPCDGETGKNFPALETAEINYGQFSTAEIIWKSILRNQS